MVKFIASQPYFHLPYRLIPGYPISSQKVLANGIDFNKDGEFETGDEVLIRGIRLYIEYAQKARELPQNARFSSIDLPVISEVKGGEKATEYVESKPVKVVADISEDTDDLWSEISRLLKS